ncbi:MAG TPA: phosphoribosylformylglycinamidine cyclo-ligase [Candidatus Acidoferrum sp.]|nr:phosphoribosylformylglycinamidine cyclo-ligase [Candidatus Acidoferrum sp.]
MRYADAGVNIALADQAKQKIARLAARTFTRGVVGGIGAFGALFQIDRKRWRDPLLVSSADGVGTKLKIAFAMNVHSTVGADLVNHCVNDILTLGAEPLFFLDYLALGGISPAVIEQIVEGISRACRATGCALIGGETAQMPGFYSPGEYDLAGFVVGAVERGHVLGPDRVKRGDELIALPSVGLHTNGYSLARKLVFDQEGLKPDTYVAAINNKIGAELLKPHVCYLPPLKTALSRGWLSAMAHITGGGIPGNLPRVLPRAMRVEIALGSWPVPPIFGYLAKIGKLDREELLSTFNLGVGMILIVPQKNVRALETDLRRRREKFYRIGQVIGGTGPRIVYSGQLQI